MTTQKLPLFLENTKQSLYANVGERILAVLLDGLFLIPLTIGMLVFNSMSLYNYYYTFVVSQLIVAVYTIYLPVRYGATPGKLVIGLTILKIDGAAISYRESFLKYLPSFLLGLFAFVIQTCNISMVDEATYNSLGWIAQSKYLQSYSPISTWLQMGIMYAYFLGSLLIVLLNSRKRSLSDVIAGTVVVYTRLLEKIGAHHDEMLPASA